MKLKIIYGNRYFQLVYLKCWPYENEGSALFQIATRLLTTEHPKLFSTYLLERNGALWKSFFSAPQNAEN